VVTTVQENSGLGRDNHVVATLRGSKRSALWFQKHLWEQEQGLSPTFR
jgi:hypothetical protein